MPLTGAAVREALDRYLHRPLFFVTLLYLLVLAGVTHRLRDPLVTDWELQLMAGGLAALSPVFWVDAVIRFLLRPRREQVGKPLLYSVALALVPPLHLGVKGYARPTELWLPFLGWQPVGKPLRQRLERLFSVPMVLMALLVVPLLIIEFGWEQARANPWMALALDLSSGIIWLGFAIEFLIMVSVAEHKLRYCARHWLDVVIVLLPVIEALPALRLLRLGQIARLQQLSRMGRVFRLRALVTRAWRALLLLNLIQRLMGSNSEKRLRQLRALLAAKQEELNELQKEIEQLEKEIAAKPREVPESLSE